MYIAIASTLPSRQLVSVSRYVDGSQSRPFGLLHPVESDLGGLAAVVRKRHHLEPGVLQCFLGSDAASRVVDKDLVEEIQKLFQEGSALGNYIL